MLIIVMVMIIVMVQERRGSRGRKGMWDGAEEGRKRNEKGIKKKGEEKGRKTQDRGVV